MVGPEAAVSVYPGVHLDETVRPQRVDAALSVGANLDEADLAEHAQVAGHRGLREIGQGGDQFSRGALAGAQRVEQSAPAWLGHGFEHVHDRSMSLSLYR